MHARWCVPVTSALRRGGSEWHQWSEASLGLSQEQNKTKSMKTLSLVEIPFMQLADI